MNVAPIIFFDMTAAILILALTLLAIVFYLSRITKSLRAKPEAKDEAIQGDANPLDVARTKAIKIIDDANNQALDIVSKVTLSAGAVSENFNKSLLRTSSVQISEFEKAISEFTKTYSQVLQDLKTKNIEAFQNVSKDIETNTMEEINSFKESMQKLTTLSQEEVRKKISIDYETSQKEIEAHKQEELAKIDSGIYELLGKVSKLVLGKALSLSEHQDLIEKALEKAKKEGIFEQS